MPVNRFRPNDRRIDRGNYGRDNGRGKGGRDNGRGNGRDHGRGIIMIMTSTNYYYNFYYRHPSEISENYLGIFNQ